MNRTISLLNDGLCFPTKSTNTGNYYCDMCGRKNQRTWYYDSGFRLCKRCANQQRRVKKEVLMSGKTETYCEVCTV